MKSRDSSLNDLTWRARLASLGNIRPLCSMLWETNPTLFLGTVLVRLLRAVLPIALLWIPKLILDGVVAISRGQGDRGSLYRLLLLELALALLSDLLSRANNALDILLGDRFTNHVAIRLMKHAAILDLASFEDPVYYDKLERVRGQATGRMFLLTSVLNAAQEAATLVALSAGLMAFSSWLMLLLAASTIPTFIGEARFSRLSYSAFFLRTPQRRELEYLRYLATCADSAKELRIFDLGSHLAKRYRALAEVIYRDNKNLAFRRAACGWALAILPALSYYAGYIVILGKVLARSISIGTFTFLTGSFARARASSERIFFNFNEICEQAHLLTDLFDFLKLKPSICSLPNALPVPRPIRKGFEFCNVSFAYPGSDRLVVSNISFRIAPSERLALVGENGAGKTTLVKLLSRMYDPVSGHILLDGIDIRNYDLSEYRQAISAIFQDFVRYDLPIRENIGFGGLEALTDDGRLKVAAHKGGATALIERFPLGLDQILGRRFEGGVDLSGGEWQKMALSRAYAREAQLVILDEPTASLDARAEHDIFERFAELTEGCMVVLISHRFSSVRIANKIIVLDRGEIREEGTHEQLMRLRGKYADLFELQAAGFREQMERTPAKRPMMPSGACSRIRRWAAEGSRG